MKPRIMIIHPNVFMYGGAERQIVELSNYLTNHDYEVAIFTKSSIPDFDRNLKEARIVKTGDDKLLIQMCQGLAYKFDLVNPHNHPAELFIPPFKIPQVWEMNEPPGEALQGKELDRNIVNLVKYFIDKIVVISDFDRERCNKIFGVDPIVNYPGIRSSFFSEGISPKDRFNLKDRFVILECGYLTWTKNQVKAVEMIPELKKEIPNIALVLAGYDKDPYVDQVKAKIKELSLENDVILTGYLDRDEDIRDLYRIASLQILPVLDQGGWATAFEGVVSGCPLLVSERFIGASLVKDHSLGYIEPLETFKDGILKCYTDLEACRDRTTKASHWIKDNLTWDKFGEKYKNIFDEMI